MNLTDSSVTSSHYYYRKRTRTTEENLNLDTKLWFKRVKRPSRLVLPRNGLRTSPTQKKESYSIDSPDTQEHDQRNNNNNNDNDGNRYLYSL